jgi:hypothetical protein
MVPKVLPSVGFGERGGRGTGVEGCQTTNNANKPKKAFRVGGRDVLRCSRSAVASRLLWRGQAAMDPDGLMVISGVSAG